MLDIFCEQLRNNCSDPSRPVERFSTLATKIEPQNCWFVPEFDQPRNSDDLPFEPIQQIRLSEKIT
jgi:hypothetical protein